MKPRPIQVYVGLTAILGVSALALQDWGFVWVYSLLGDDDRAVEHLDSLLASSVGPSVNEIRSDPWFDGLHSHPRFQALLAKYADDVEH